MFSDFPAWWEALSTLSKVYWSIAFPSTLLFLIQLVMTFIGGDGDHDYDDFDHDGDFDADHGGFHIFTFKNLVAFFTLFAWSGLACIEGGFSLAIVIIISVISVFFYHSVNQDHDNRFVATTEISPISTLEEGKYNFINNFFFEFYEKQKKINFSKSDERITGADLEVTRDILLIHFFEAINEKTFFEKAMRKFKLLDASKYINDKKYNEAIV